MEKQIYKNLYYDDEGKYYEFVNGNDRRLVVEQEAYLIIYLLETMLRLESKIPEVYNLNN